METTEYIEYCEDEVKREIKQDHHDLEIFQSRNSEYFEEDVKEDIVDEKKQDSIMVQNNICNICSKCYKSKRNLKTHIESIHEKVKYPGNLCEYK